MKKIDTPEDGWTFLPYQDDWLYIERIGKSDWLVYMKKEDKQTKVRLLLGDPNTYYGADSDCWEFTLHYGKESPRNTPKFYKLIIKEAMKRLEKLEITWNI